MHGYFNLIMHSGKDYYIAFHYISFELGNITMRKRMWQSNYEYNNAEDNVKEYLYEYNNAKDM